MHKSTNLQVINSSTFSMPLYNTRYQRALTEITYWFRNNKSNRRSIFSISYSLHFSSGIALHRYCDSLWTDEYLSASEKYFRSCSAFWWIICMCKMDHIIIQLKCRLHSNMDKHFSGQFWYFMNYYREVSLVVFWRYNYCLEVEGYWSLDVQKVQMCIWKTWQFITTPLNSREHA